MIYITNEYCEISDSTHILNVWEVEQSNVEELYKNFMLEKASSLGVVVNPHWFMIMNYFDHHSHLKRDEYSKLSKEWNKFKDVYTIDKFISDELKGNRLEFTNLEAA
jgi:predicted transcriptional regulator